MSRLTTQMFKDALLYAHSECDADNNNCIVVPPSSTPEEDKECLSLLNGQIEHFLDEPFLMASHFMHVGYRLALLAEGKRTVTEEFAKTTGKEKVN